MSLALAQAATAADRGEVPVGAVVVKDGQVIGWGANTPIQAHDPSAHAEMVALRRAAAHLGNYRLDGCEIFVTLEPCAMCSGAILHARLARLVYGASEPKTGAAGSVVNLFANPQLNHQTQVSRGVLENVCAEMLQQFFQHKRDEKKLAHQPLRQDALRTSSARFEGLPDYPWEPRYVQDLPALDGFRLHYLDEGSRFTPKTWLFVHELGHWSYQYRHLIPELLALGHRVIAPDLIGFGKSDKPKRQEFHTLASHRQVLLALIEHLDLQDVVLVVPNWAALLGLNLAEPQCKPVSGVWILQADPRNRDLAQALKAPFPDRGYEAALRAFPSLSGDAQFSERSDGLTRPSEMFSSEWQVQLRVEADSLDLSQASPTVTTITQAAAAFFCSSNNDVNNSVNRSVDKS
jgi:tRNA(adenine34) deaminase